MEAEVPYMPSVTNLHKILDAIQNAGAPDAFGLDFLKDLGFTSSNDRPVIKLLKFLGLLDPSGKPTQTYKEFMDHNKAKTVLAGRLVKAYDDLFLSDKDAASRTVEKLKGWFKTKTGVGDAVATKMATTFRSLASYGDFTKVDQAEDKRVQVEEGDAKGQTISQRREPDRNDFPDKGALAFTYRIEVHLPDTTNIETYRSIFRAIREELQS
jgi:hypothetical protein